MDPRILARLRCPVCGEPLAEAAAGTARALRCPRRHSFDIARQGYVNLLAGRAPHTGDSAEMVAARADFLAAGHYAAVAAALAAAAADATARGDGAVPYPLVVDAGAGTGWYLAAVLAALPDAVGLALDVSKPALRRAARAHPRAAAALADTWQRLPLADHGAAVLLNVFAPRNGAEFHRVLDPAGALLVVTPAEDHLAELVDALDLLRVDPAKADRVAGSLGGHFTEESTVVHRARPALTRTEVATLVGMGPSAWHADPARLAERIAALPEPVPVTVAVRLGVHRPR
ncbi:MULTISPECIES: putative RNA methyltransferase [Micromonospora]|uniref:23S rRNA methyltransferase n=1 Tax=Micromonospora solifontis TaxID=2487138 RepID=A0ABX9WDW5_9ACTN|nr:MULTISPECIES: 23S rRNA methyltransferase [Micromonospora]NES14262.1 23S rRNA methyltransferase [Micromonospora sp. PPF5-17B]NES38464.1 23S rRNA methyltransferase [Micromonospora solifontis]NES55789.1 23S rRNA methyltransferase [Micromonospora sp. PPF5-6]RNL95768.1 23S rRNA methyltransferase [Micromonospora solifontis]